MLDLEVVLGIVNGQEFYKRAEDVDAEWDDAFQANDLSVRQCSFSNIYSLSWPGNGVD